MFILSSNSRFKNIKANVEAILTFTEEWSHEIKESEEIRKSTRLKKV